MRRLMYRTLGLGQPAYFPRPSRWRSGALERGGADDTEVSA
ncbi:hypothetical protein NKH77_35270 [Streptomyces sp. M19]